MGRHKNVKGKRSDTKIAKLQRRLEQWRGGKKLGERMPERLWAAVVKIARELGLAPAVRELKVDYYALKHRLEGKGATELVEPKPAFIEVNQLGSLANLGGQGEWSIEVEERSGTKFRVEYKGPLAPDLRLLQHGMLGAGR